VPEISHVRFAVPEQAALNRVLREAGALSLATYARIGSRTSPILMFLPAK
jgi:hypothetical protein